MIEKSNKDFIAPQAKSRGYKDNKYLKDLERNKKIIYNLINLKMYFLIRLIFVVKEWKNAKI